jgi:hypothetical protein
MGKIIGICVALVIVIVMAFPFAREAFHRYEVTQRLKPLMSDRDLAAWRNWNGDAQSFGRTLLERCELSNGPNSPACEPYRSAIQ